MDRDRLERKAMNARRRRAELYLIKKATRAAAETAQIEALLKKYEKPKARFTL